MLSRRTVLLGGTAAGAVVAVGAGVGVERGVLPGRPWAQAHLGLNGSPGVVPDIEPGPVAQGSFVSEARLGAETGWCLISPPGEHDELPVVVALHGHGADHASLLKDQFGLDRYLAAAVADGVPPFAIAAADGGGNYWHPRPDGDDASAMVVDELLPMLADGHGVRTDRIGLLGWSMGGYGALRLAALLGPDRVGAVVAVSPAVWRDPDDASRKGFVDAAEYEEYSVMGRQEELAGIPVRVDCGTGDPFYREVQAYADGFDDVTSSFDPGAHDPDYWRRMLPVELAFLGEHVGSTT
ncbi:alpha/beta hydrolase [Nocardioides caricicola]|uniref:Acyl-CoA:diacylglycerol acyltransferase n=1 Tax=Nocardioides caricicola TaxID=634770 RepID=A0ABW0N511_9ACTN